MQVAGYSTRAYTEHDEYFVEFYPRADGEMQPVPSYPSLSGERPESILLPSPQAAWSHFLCSVLEYAQETPGAWLYHRIGPEFQEVLQEDWTGGWPLGAEEMKGYRVYARLLISRHEPQN